ncbi:MAG: prolycopene isomerase [Syntrophaceae bacterium]|nr:MAG: prolycopene isomerase [Syntrophaceae bacterium]
MSSSHAKEGRDLTKHNSVFDAVVVGAGNGGLTGALTLCKAGKKVLLLERHNIPGGCGTTFRRGRFEFEVALHQLYDISNNYRGEKGSLRRLFEELNVWNKIEFVLQKEAFRLAIPGVGEIVLPGDHDGFVRKIQEIAPDHADAIREYQALVDKIGEETALLYKSVAEDEPLTKEKAPIIFEFGSLTGKEVLDRYFKNSIVKGIYKALFGYLGMPVDRVPFLALAALYARGDGTCYVKGGSQAMSNALADEFLASGGTIKFNTAVEKILVEDGAVRGVMTDAGESFKTDTVLCNANKINVYVDMIEEQHVPESVFADLRVSTPSMSSFGLFIGLDCTAEEAGIRNATSFMAAPLNAPRMRYDVGLHQTSVIPGGYMSCYSIDDPDCSPEGTSMLTILSSQTADSWISLPPEKYHEAKMQYATKLLDFLYQFYPKIRGHIEEMEAFTPLTLMRYINSPGGCIYGVDAYFKDLVANKMQARSPIKGLYFCGASLLFGGFNTTLTSGHTAARLILKDQTKNEAQGRAGFEGLAGLDSIQKEIEVGKRYNLDHRCNRGGIKRALDVLHPKRIEYRVTEIRRETDSARTIRLAPTGGYLPPFVPGQYINLEVEIDGIRTSRPYSISSPATQRACYEITVRSARNGFVSDYLLGSLKVGDLVSSSGPAGNFYRIPDVHGKRLVFIAGGSGITPFMSMLQTDADKLDRGCRIDLIYGCAREQDIIFKTRLRKLEKAGFVKTHPVISEPGADCRERQGFVTADIIKDVAGDITQCTFFLSGPTAMYDFVLPELQKLGVSDRQIRREVQTASDDATKLPGWPQGISGKDQFTVSLPDGRKLAATACETVLVALERAGVTVPSLCRGGECSACRTKLRSGRVFHPPSELLRKSDMRFGYIHPCVTYPISNIEIML